MKQYLFILLFFPVGLTAQTTVLELFNTFNDSKSIKHIKENHTVKTYTRHFDEEKKPDLTLTIDGEKRDFDLMSTSTNTWNDKILTTSSKSSLMEDIHTTTFIYDNNGMLIGHNSSMSNDETGFFDEKKTLIYDQKGRLLTFRMKKEKMGVDSEPVNITYSGNDVLPESMKMILVGDMNVTRTKTAKGYRYNLETDLEKFIESYRKETGSKDSREKILKEMGPFGKPDNMYSDVTFVPDGSIKEEYYQEDKEDKKGKMLLTKTIVFDKNLKPLSITIHGETPTTIAYEYDDQNRVLSIQNGDEEKRINKYDASGNALVINDENGTTISEYKDGKLFKETVTSYGDITEIRFFTYP